jgi:pyrimidine operon attenuation protein / uracil phosphoribosyltransferase
MESMEETRNCVIDAAGIGRKMKRMALEVAEQNFDVKELVIAAINGNGEVVARHLIKEVEKFFTISYVKVILNKKDPLEASLEHQVDMDHKVILLVDDVANSGKTMLYALKPLLERPARRIQTLVLVERSHKLFPVQTDYKGLSIATTLQEHIAVETNGRELTGAWLY